jgi:hypothetical protein
VHCGDIYGSDATDDNSTEDIGVAKQELLYCGASPYNPDFSICCGNVLSPKGGNNACCGTSPYNPDFSICCGNVLSPKGGNNACCDTSPYNPDFSICCGNVLSPKGGNNACCGTVPYNTSYSNCCSSPEAGTHGQIPTTQSANGLYQFHDVWCSIPWNIPPQCVGGNFTKWQSVASQYCTSVGSGGSCTDPNAGWHVTCNALIDCIYDCNGTCNPVGC